MGGSSRAIGVYCHAGGKVLSIDKTVASIFITELIIFLYLVIYQYNMRTLGMLACLKELNTAYLFCSSSKESY